MALSHARTQSTIGMRSSPDLKLETSVRKACRLASGRYMIWAGREAGQGIRAPFGPGERAVTPQGYTVGGVRGRGGETHQVMSPELVRIWLSSMNLHAHEIVNNVESAFD